MRPIAERALRSLELALVRLQAQALRSPRGWLAAGALAVALALALGTRVRALTAIEDIVDSDFAASPRLALLQEVFEDKHGIFLTLGRRDGRAPTTEEACALRSWLAREGRDNPLVRREFSVFSIRQAARENGRLWFPAVLSPDCSRPEGDVAPALARLASSPWGGVVSSARTNDLAAELYLADNTPGSRFGSFDPSAVRALVDRFDREILARDPALVAHWTGMAAYQMYVNEGYFSVFLLNLAVLALLGLLARAFFGTWRSAGVLVAALAAASALMHGAMGALGFPLDVLSSNLFLMLAVSTIEDFLFVSWRLLEGREHWRRVFRRLITPSFLTSATTIIGFSSLALSELGIVRHFGLMAAFGAFLEWAVIFLLLPPLLALRPGLRRWADSRRALARAGFAARFRLPRGAALAALAVLPVAAICAFRLNIYDSPERAFPPSHPFRATYDYFGESRDTKAMISLVFENLEDEPRNRAALAAVRALPDVARVEDPYAAEEFLLAGLPAESARAARGFAREPSSNPRLLGPGGRARAIVLVKRAEIDAIASVRLAAERACPKGECWVAGTMVAYEEFAERVRRTLLESLLASLALVGATLAFLARATGRGRVFPSLLSAFWGPGLALAGAAAFRVPISFVTCMFGAVLVGLTGDNTVQFLLASRGRALGEGARSLAGASWIMAVAMVAVSLSFCFSYFEPARVLGWLLAGGCAASFVGDVWILRGLSDRSSRGITRGECDS
jgi:predicted RND superfamily exporter protein